MKTLISICELYPTCQQGMTDEECTASLSTVWSYGTGGTNSDRGISILQSLVDLGDLETGGAMAMEVGQKADTETLQLMEDH